ncbi:MAG TPA: M48 family metalloprotease [Candidatus Brocadiia bacterium]|nr:M48 family metalloprotease [Candidatus Brocadiia bacterium]
MWEQIRANRRKSVALVIVMAGILLIFGFVIGEAAAPGAGPGGVFLALIIWLIMSLISYFAGGAIMLSVSGARKIEKQDNPRLFNIVEEMQLASGLPKMPDVYVIDDHAPNAFATGRDPQHCAVAVTTGLLNICNRDELQGVIAHEMAHVKNRDVLLMIMVGVLMGTIVMLADGLLRAFFWGGGGRRRSRTSSSKGGQAQAVMLIVALLLAILAPIIAQLLYLAVSRKREYLADACGAQFTRYPEGLASALEKISASTHDLRRANRATAPMYIINPLKQEGMAAANLSSTHPPIDERVRILRGMGGGAGYNDYESAYRKVTGKAGILPSGALAGSQPAEARQAIDDKEALKSDVERVRETTDMLWKMKNYAFIPCACGVTLKVPPGFNRPEIKCPHCGTAHKTQAT